MLVKCISWTFVHSSGVCIASPAYVDAVAGRVLFGLQLLLTPSTSGGKWEEDVEIVTPSQEECLNGLSRASGGSLRFIINNNIMHSG